MDRVTCPSHQKTKKKIPHCNVNNAIKLYGHNIYTLAWQYLCHLKCWNIFPNANDPFSLIFSHLEVK